ncbi:MAG: hypothetical protein SWH68_12580 [Thermodesulfobacteriota bacterium]|nr:hypothetical protein [Thermodesulfobacteriota bacterium]
MLDKALYDRPSRLIMLAAPVAGDCAAGSTEELIAFNTKQLMRECNDHYLRKMRYQL